MTIATIVPSLKESYKRSFGTMKGLGSSAINEYKYQAIVQITFFINQILTKNIVITITMTIISPREIDIVVRTLKKGGYHL